MADDEWMMDDPADSAPTEEAPAAPAEEEAAPAEGGEAHDEGIDDEELDDEPFRKPRRDRGDRPMLFRHWKRPVNLQYAYLYDYRHNYYDDVIDYLDRRQHGIDREIPRAQTWAERALRTYASKSRTHSEDYYRREKDISLLSNVRTSARFYRHHANFSSKYLSLM